MYPDLYLVFGTRIWPALEFPQEPEEQLKAKAPLGAHEIF